MAVGLPGKLQPWISSQYVTTTGRPASILTVLDGTGPDGAPAAACLHEKGIVT